MSAIPYRTSPVPAPGERPNLTSESVAIGLKAFFRAADAWKLSNDEARALLGFPGRATFFQWKKGEAKRIPHDTLRRISYVLGIWKALQMLFKSPAQADAWVRRPNELLGGQSALERMLAGDISDLAVVRGVLDAARGTGA